MSLGCTECDDYDHCGLTVQLTRTVSTVVRAHGPVDSRESQTALALCLCLPLPVLSTPPPRLLLPSLGQLSKVQLG